MFSPESSSAVGEAIGWRGDGSGTSAVESQGLPGCRPVAVGAISGTSRSNRAAWPLVVPESVNQVSALNFMQDTLYDGRKFRLLDVIDEGNREALRIECGSSTPSTRLLRVLEELIDFYGKPQAIRMDNGPEITSAKFVNWPEHRSIEMLLHPARQAEPECLRRTLQQERAAGDVQCLAIRLTGAGAADSGRMAHLVQHGALS
jgi:hypothetical protein